MRIIIMGTGPFAVPTAERLLADGHDVPLVVTRPLVDPKAKKLPPRPVYDWAQQHGLEVYEPASINTDEAIAHLKPLQADLFFVCDYGQILSNDCLAASRLGGINLHGSILPRHRGAAPVQWALLRGDSVAGITVIHMTTRLDGGPALAIAETPVQPDETAEGLEPRLAMLGVEATVDAIIQLENWDGQSAIGTLQDKSLVTKAPRFSKSHGQLDFRLPAEYLVRLVRACQPWPSTFAELQWPDGKKTLRLIVRAARVTDSASALEDLEPGEARELDCSELSLIGGSSVDTSGCWRKVLAVKTSDGIFLIGRIQPAGKREMDAQDFLKGHAVVEGCRFVLPETPIAPLC